MLQIRYLYLFCVACIVVGLPSSTQAFDPRVLRKYFRMAITDALNMIKTLTNTNEELGQSLGQCDNNFLDYVLYSERMQCKPGDKSIQHLFPADSIAVRKPPLMIKCLSSVITEQDDENGNGTLFMAQNVKDIIALLKPFGNATKRHEAGRCVLLYFWTETSMPCSLVAREMNFLPNQFPYLRFAAVDAVKISTFNTDFGIVGLPTLLLFHQGRPFVKYNPAAGTPAAFITRHTGMRSFAPSKLAKHYEGGPLPLKPVQKTDYLLVLAWTFIIFFFGRMFLKSRLCLCAFEMMQRMWRESTTAYAPTASADD